MAKLRITKADLIGGIAGFPIEVVQKMLDEQFLQGNKVSLKVFQNKSDSDLNHGGFNWDNTKDGREFWSKVINHKKFDKFFGKYPQRYNWVYIVGDSEVGYDIITTLEARGGINKHDFDGDSNDVIYYIDPVTNYIEICTIGSDLYNVVSSVFTCIDAEEQKIVISLQKIAEILDVDVNRIVIK